MALASAPAAVVVGARPLARLQRVQGELVHRVAQVRVAGEPEHHDHLLAAALGDGDGAGGALEMAEGLPAPGGVAQLGVEARHGRAAPPAGQRPRPLSRRHAPEKIGDRLPVGVDRGHGDAELLEQGPDESRLDPDDVRRHRQLRALDEGPQLGGTRATEPMCARPPVPLPLGQGRQRGRRRICAHEVPAPPALEVVDEDRKSTRLNSSHSQISYAVFCLKKKKAKYVEKITLPLALTVSIYHAMLYFVT